MKKALFGKLNGGYQFNPNTQFLKSKNTEGDKMKKPLFLIVLVSLIVVNSAWAGPPVKLINTASPLTIYADGASTSLINSYVCDSTNVTVTTVNESTSGTIWNMFSNAGGGSWLYRKVITISNSLAKQDDYQVNVTTGTIGTAALISAGKMKSDFSDVRFADFNNKELNYWVKTSTGLSYGFWVRVSTLTAAGNSSIFVYYGNSSAISSSNGDNTFQFFDDFSSGTSSKWTIALGTWAVVTTTLPDGSNGYAFRQSGMKAVDNRAYTGIPVSTYNVAMDGYTNPTGIQIGGVFCLKFNNVSNGDQTCTFYGAGRNAFTKERSIFRHLTSGSGGTLITSYGATTGTGWREMTFSTYGTNYSLALGTWTLSGTYTGSSPSASRAALDSYWDAGTGVATYFWQIRVRKYVSPAPAITAVGTEEAGPAGGVTFNISGTGTLSGTTRKNIVNGVSTINMISTVSPGTATLTATSASYTQGTVEVLTQPLPNPPTKILCTASPTSIYNNGVSTSTIRARICDYLNNLVVTAANTVNFSISGAGGTIATTQRVASGGIATVKLTATTTPGASTVTATTSGLTQGTVAVTTQQCKLLCTAQPTAIYNNGTSTSLITARVCDAADALIATAANTVNFSVSGGCGTIATTQMVASGGIATVKLTSTVTTGSATVTATSSGLTQGTVNVDVQSYKLLCTAQPASITNTGATTSLITARVCDLTDTLVTTATNTINFSVSGSAGTIATTQCNASGGIATVKLTSTVNYGTATVTATSSGIMQGTVSVMVTQVATKLLCTASPAAINADNVATSLITARVSDPGNALVSTATNTVLFTITGQGTLLGATSKIASGGMATVLIRSTLTIGTATVTATSTNLSSGTVAVKVTNLPPIAGLAVSSYGKFEITLTWTQGTYSRFRVDRSLNSGFTSSTTLCNWNSNITQPTYADTNLTANTIYYYKVYGYTTGETNISEPCTAVSQKTDDAENKIIASIFTDVVHGSDVKISIPAGTFSTDSYIEITPNPVNAAISNANAKIGEFIKPDSSEYEIGVYNLAGGNLWNAEEYNHDITLKMYYDKKYMTDHGIIEDTLKLFALDEEKQLWEKVDGEQNVFSTFNPPYVQVVLPHFSIYCLLGSGENMKVFNLINFPNPFSYETVFSFELTMDASKVVLGIYTISGRLVSKFEDTAGMSYGYNEMPIGTGSVVWDGTDVNGDPLANGVYIYKLTATPDSDIYGEGIYKPGNASGKLMIVK